MKSCQRKGCSEDRSQISHACCRGSGLGSGLGSGPVRGVLARNGIHCIFELGIAVAKQRRRLWAYVGGGSTLVRPRQTSRQAR